MEFFLKDLNPFKIETKFKFELIPGFLIQNPFGIRPFFEKESCSF
jgi:hypothetical protein